MAVENNYRLLNSDEIETLYPKLFEEVFGHSDIQQAPSIVVVEGEIRAFLAGYWHNRNTFYIAHSGVRPKYNGKFLGTKLLRNCLRYIKENTGVRYFLTMTPNDNVPAIKVLLNTGFKIIGVRQDTNKNLYVEWIKGE